MNLDGLQAPPDPPYRTDTIELHDGRRLGFCEFGDPDGEPVLWFHGTPGARRQIPPDAPGHAAEHGIRLVTPERGGVGASTADFDRTMASWAEDVEQLADTLDLERFGAAGLSGGGPHVLSVAHALPDRVTGGALLGSMVPLRGPDAPPSVPDLLSVGLGIATKLRKPLAAVMSGGLKRVELDDVDKIFPLVMKVLPEGDAQVVGSYGFKTMFVEDLYTASRDQFNAQMIDMSALVSDWGFSPRDVTVPIRSWHGSEDQLVSLGHARHLVDLLPNAELQVVEGGGHFAGYIQAPAVLEWLMQQATADSAPTLGSSA